MKAKITTKTWGNRSLEEEEENERDTITQWIQVIVSESGFLAPCIFFPSLFLCLFLRSFRIWVNVQIAMAYGCMYECFYICMYVCMLQMFTLSICSYYFDFFSLLETSVNLNGYWIWNVWATIWLLQASYCVEKKIQFKSYSICFTLCSIMFNCSALCLY